MAEEAKTKQVTIKRACQQVVDGKLQKLAVGQTLALPIIDANHLIGLNKAVEGAVKIEVPKKPAAPDKK